jgi:hypothetical protein
MDQAAVQAAMEMLWSQGRTLSAGNLRKVLGCGSLRDIVKCRNALLSLMEGARTDIANLAVMTQEAVQPLASGNERFAVVPALPLRERPLCLCGRCGMGRWFEWDVGVWKCELCGIDPPA